MLSFCQRVWCGDDVGSRDAKQNRVLRISVEAKVFSSCMFHVRTNQATIGTLTML